ncbi:hypothetical protein BU25DRAFT_103793 [Macroventuria anomochaeta]|uniref:Uncharacterized protein n=1 Tax=Macroventuria anomochaeta TaxID=301207 RepID=A0ACB6RZ65_9PLEO|nr:uncharacterized protein BU25DRAFT_103793 [Macroventuria anomochaeta]KAF2626229.1 hypothetical protein BU25DRAFT_103793 [Macroventuria anomochaeta]
MFTAAARLFPSPKRLFKTAMAFRSSVDTRSTANCSAVPSLLCGSGCRGYTWRLHLLICLYLGQGDSRERCVHQEYLGGEREARPKEGHYRVEIVARQCSEKIAG